MRPFARFWCMLALLGCVGCGTGPRSIFDRVLQSKVELTDSLYFVTSEETVERLFMPNWTRYTDKQTEFELELLDWGRLGDTPGLAREMSRILEDNTLNIERKREEAKKKAKDKDGDYNKILDYCVAKRIFVARKSSMDNRYNREVERLKNMADAYRIRGVACPMLDQALRDLTTYTPPTYEAGEISSDLIILFDPKKVAEAEKEEEIAKRAIVSRPPRYRMSN